MVEEVVLKLTVLGVSLSVSAILSGASAFLLGFYLFFRQEGREDKAKVYRKLIYALTIPAIIIGISSLVYSFHGSLNIPDQAMLIISSLASLFPPIIFLVFVAKKY